MVADFGSRRAHGPEAGVLAARASYIGGCNATSNCFAGKQFDIPVLGTIAHSFILAFPSEMEAFNAYLEAFPQSTVLLIDTYDTLEAAKLATRWGNKIKAVRIDSGNLIELSKAVRKILDDGGCRETKIIVSGNMDEYKIRDLLSAGAPIDSFGVGTEMVTSGDSPSVGVVYKMVEQDKNGPHRFTAKLSGGKTNYPGEKQICRFLDENGKIIKDKLTLASEKPPENSIPLMIPIMENGKRVVDLPSIKEIQKVASMNVQQLQEQYLNFDVGMDCPIEYSDGLEDALNEVKKKYKR